MSHPSAARQPFPGRKELIQHLQSHLQESGYQPSSARPCERAVEQLLDWVSQRGKGLADVDDRVLEAFGRHQSRGGGSALTRGVIEFLRKEGLVPQAPERPLPPVIVDFRRWMSSHRGAMDSTLDVYCTVLRKLVDCLGEDARRYEVEDLQQFVLDRASADHGGHIVTPVRMFLRYLACQGLVSDGLRDAVPTVAHWRLAALPRGIPQSDIRRLLKSCNCRTAVGLRDHAVLLLGYDLALRAGDIAALRLPDVDWREATLTVAGKSRRAHRLPLPQRVGDALLAYLARGRPKISDDHVFLRALAPLGPLTRWAVSDIVERALRRAGVQAPSRGTHLLRHSVATALVQRGCPLRSIADLLRHRSIETTAIYSKVDTKSLRTVAQPWPEVRPC